MVQVKNPPQPGTEEWQRMVTASKVAPMVTDKSTGEYLGIGYVSAYEQFMEMTGQWSRDIDAATQEMFDDAHDAEDYAVNVWKRKNPGWRTSKGEIAYTDDTLPFPNLVTLDRRAVRGRAKQIIEVKRPRVPRGVEDKWLVQVQFQMGVSGIHRASLVEVPVYGKPVIHSIKFDSALFAGIVEDAKNFYRLVELNFPPAVGDSEHAKGILAALNPVDESQPPVQLDQDMMDGLIDAWKRQKAIESEVSEWENRVYERMGQSPRAEYEGRPVVTRPAGRFAASRVPKDKQELLKDPELASPKLDPKKLKEKYPDVYESAIGEAKFTCKKKEWVG
ncbi:hypothetical protein [Corynebacterium accolens]|uniref:hypothetical protein n=1 Tax=Corynebacterium accolens TaxID=38284 RepID=UPI00266FB79A|nr:hypothetical protein [Corynebacterium accolens]WKS54943.1 hypothetical protein NLL31_06840 [Corynebacterium accolens]